MSSKATKKPTKKPTKPTKEIDETHAVFLPITKNSTKPAMWSSMQAQKQKIEELEDKVSFLNAETLTREAKYKRIKHAIIRLLGDWDETTRARAVPEPVYPIYPVGHTGPRAR